MVSNKEKQKEYSRIYYKKHKEEILNRNKEYRKNNPLKIKQWQRKWYHDNLEKMKIKDRKYRESRKERLKQYRKDKKEHIQRIGRDYRVKERDEVFTYYGGYRCHCECRCSEINPLMLTIDHMNNDGAKHRKEIGPGKLYRWLIRNNFPEGFQVLCYNCNVGRWRNKGKCPRLEIV